MKGLFSFILLCCTLSAWADVTYPVNNFKYISDWDYREEVQDSDKFVVMIFSNKTCLERVIIEGSCFLFERKLDYFIPSFSPKIKVVGFNAYYENYTVVSQFNIQNIPTVIILKNNQILKRFEATYAQPDINNGRMGWQDELLKEVLSTINQIR